MKKIVFTLLIASLIMFGFSSCKKTNVTNPGTTNLPDATFSATITGAISQQLGFTIPNQSSSEHAASGGYSTTDDQMTFVFYVGESSQKVTQQQISMTATAGSLSNGTYTCDAGAYIDASNATSFGNLISGSITITKVELYQNMTGGTSVNWVSGNATLILEDAGNPGSQITINCQFSNINTSKI